MIYADIRTTVAESLPPQTTAEIIISQMPEGVSAPDYILTDAFERQEDESWCLVSSSGTVYQVPKDCPVISYGMNELSSFRIISESNKRIRCSELSSFRLGGKSPVQYPLEQHHRCPSGSGSKSNRRQPPMPDQHIGQNYADRNMQDGTKDRNLYHAKPAIKAHKGIAKEAEDIKDGYHVHIRPGMV